MSLPVFRADLHVHTCLSPCADVTMMPTAIIEHAARRGIDIVAICDHNSAENVTAVQEAGRGSRVTVWGGMEITTAEEVHILGLFGSQEELLKMQDIVYGHLQGVNAVDPFGPQLVVDAHDEIRGCVEQGLGNASTLSVDAVVAAIREHRGVAIASHIDREAFGILGQLGMVPRDLPLHAVEVSPRCDAHRRRHYEQFGLPVVASSDAHFLSDIGSVHTTFHIGAPTVEECALALSRKDGRSFGE